METKEKPLSTTNEDVNRLIGELASSLDFENIGPLDDRLKKELKEELKKELKKELKNKLKLQDTTVESTTHIEANATVSYKNAIMIQNITNTWFQLMVLFNESAKVRSFFAYEKYDKNENKWEIEATPYTHHFLTTGITIYEVIDISDDPSKNRISHIVITKETKNEDKIKLALAAIDKDKYEVNTLISWVGCGMRIPSNVFIHLDPNIVWPVLTLKVKNGDVISKIKIENTANEIFFSEDESTGYIQVKNKHVQGLTAGKIKVTGTEETLTIEEVREAIGNPLITDTEAKLAIDRQLGLDEGTTDELQKTILKMPYTCASFDILTNITLDNDEIVIFTS